MVPSLCRRKKHLLGEREGRKPSPGETCTCPTLSVVQVREAGLLLSLHCGDTMSLGRGLMPVSWATAHDEGAQASPPLSVLTECRSCL